MSPSVIVDDIMTFNRFFKGYWVLGRDSHVFLPMIIAFYIDFIDVEVVSFLKFFNSLGNVQGRVLL